MCHDLSELAASNKKLKDATSDVRTDSLTYTYAIEFHIPRLSLTPDKFPSAGWRYEKLVGK
jgi:hypothetical protein